MTTIVLTNHIIAADLQSTQGRVSSFDSKFERQPDGSLVVSAGCTGSVTRYLETLHLPAKDRKLGDDFTLYRLTKGHVTDHSCYDGELTVVPVTGHLGTSVMGAGSGIRHVMVALWAGRTLGESFRLTAECDRGTSAQFEVYDLRTLRKLSTKQFM